ncbi:MAG: hypothetical protein M3N49_10590 [Candidatus Eremiobacteraeota bacterium]|nr:hypothetical protein [Candidatus Eremiobacteraeota bacterium]
MVRCFVGSPPQQVVEPAGPWRADEGWWARATGEGAPLARDDHGWSMRGVYD